MTATLLPVVEERCPRTDLYPSMCGHCRGHTGPDFPPSDVDIVRRWNARAPGECGLCGEDYDQNDPVGLDESGARVCWRCLP